MSLIILSQDSNRLNLCISAIGPLYISFSYFLLFFVNCGCYVDPGSRTPRAVTPRSMTSRSVVSRSSRTLSVSSSASSVDEVLDSDDENISKKWRKSVYVSRAFEVFHYSGDVKGNLRRNMNHKKWVLK